ncbi:hypothetical protein MRY82_09245 [bacterium]|nr:hypothetical protein [bacterium]
MRISIIDLGSNSVRFDIYQLFGDQTYKKLYGEKLMIQLGKDVFAKGFFSKNSINNTSQVFKHFSQISEQLYVDQIHAYATAAVRYANNKDEFINTIHQRSNIKLTEISGKQEAKLIYQGIKKNLVHPQEKSFLCIDIGGGSTELSLSHKSKVYHHSIPLGSSLIRAQFLKKTTPNIQEQKNLQEYVQKHLKKHLKTWPKVKSLIAYGSSGTVKGIIKVLNKGRYINQNCSSTNLSKLLEQTALLNTEQLKAVPYLEEKRIDMFTGGNILLNEILKFFECSSLSYTDTALKEGLLNSALKAQKPKYTQIQNIDFSSIFFKKNTLPSSHKQWLPHLKKLFSRILIKDKSSIKLGMTATVLGRLCNAKKLNYRFSDYMLIAQNYPYYQSQEEYSDILSIFQLLLESDDRTFFEHEKKQLLKKIAVALKVILWLFNNNPRWIYTYKVSKKYFYIELTKRSFLKQKQFDQIKKSFEEQFDLKIKLL